MEMKMQISSSCAFFDMDVVLPETATLDLDDLFNGHNGLVDFLLLLDLLFDTLLFRQERCWWVCGVGLIWYSMGFDLIK